MMVKDIAPAVVLIWISKLNPSRLKIVVAGVDSTR